MELFKIKKKGDVVDAMLVLTGILFILTCILGVIFAVVDGNRQDKVLSEIVGRGLNGNDAVQYCTENYDMLGFNHKTTTACYNLIKTRNMLE